MSALARNKYVCVGCDVALMCKNVLTVHKQYHRMDRLRIWTTVWCRDIQFGVPCLLKLGASAGQAVAVWCSVAGCTFGNSSCSADLPNNIEGSSFFQYSPSNFFQCFQNTWFKSDCSTNNVAKVRN